MIQFCALFLEIYALLEPQRGGRTPKYAPEREALPCVVDR